VEGFDAVKIGVRIELVDDVEGGADCDFLLGKVVAMDEDLADLVGGVGILAVVGAVACFEEVGVAGGSAEEAAVGVLVDRAQRSAQRICFRAWLIAVPLEVGPFPEEVPHIAGTDEPHFGDGFLDLLAGTLKGGADEEEFDAGVVEALPFAHLVAQVQRGTAVRPELLFEGRGVFGDFGFGEGHEGNKDGI